MSGGADVKRKRSGVGKNTMRLHHLFGEIDTMASLRLHLQIAVELEAATLPPYLCAYYSIKDGHNQEAAGIIRSVLMEEMLHLALAANVLNAIGGYVRLNNTFIVPRYPATLPHSRGDFLVSLGPFSKSVVETFMKIERPGKADAKPEADRYHSIGQFYAAIRNGLRKLASTPKAYTGNPDYQVTPEYYYGSGKLRAVRNLEDGEAALDMIVDQGEGLRHEIVTSDKKFSKIYRDENIAHYFRFNEILCGRRYDVHEDSPNRPPTGKQFTVNWAETYPMRLDPRTADYPAGSELWNLSMKFSRAYMRLLNTLNRGFNGEPRALMESVNIMYEMKYAAVALMKIPWGENTTAGPAFEYLPPASQS